MFHSTLVPILAASLFAVSGAAHAFETDVIPTTGGDLKITCIGHGTLMFTYHQMKALKDIDVAFLPMNLPYTMTPEMVADAAKTFQPAILYPYHYGDTKTARLVDLLAGTDIDVRIRRLA